MITGFIDQHAHSLLEIEEGEYREIQIYLTASTQALVGAGLMIDRLVTFDYRSGVLRIEK